MSKAHPECPLADHQNCRHCDNPEICALVREDRTCQRRIAKRQKPEAEEPE